MVMVMVNKRIYLFMAYPERPFLSFLSSFFFHVHVYVRYQGLVKMYIFADKLASDLHQLPPSTTSR